MTSLSILDIDHMLRCKVANLLEELEESLSITQYEIIEINLKQALSAINDELCDLEDE